MESSGRSDPIAAPRPTRNTAQAIFFAGDSFDLEKRKIPLAQRAGPAPKKTTQARASTG
jgi:hypothetical protein